MDFQIDEPRFYEAVYRGVYDAIWAVATNATGAPCSDFYDSIQKGVKDAVSNMDINHGGSD